MPRSFTYQALTLRVKPSGESNREAWFLTAEEGIIRATVFGGPKSRLRARVAPYHEGKLWIYHDPVRDSRKVSDFDVQSYRTGIRELYERAMCAGAVAGTILASRGGGFGGSGTLHLTGSILDALETADAEASSRIGIYFLWQWAQVLGEKPDLSYCAACGKELKQGEALWYHSRKETIYCENCMERLQTAADALSAGLPPAHSSAGVGFRLGPGAINWLKATEPLSAPDILRVSLDNSSQEQAKTFVKAVLAGSLGQRLNTWEGI